MKNLKIKLIMGLLLGSVSILLHSCSTDSDGAESGSLEISGVYKYTYVRPSESEPIDYSAPLDSLTTVGYSGISYLIRGTGLATAKKITVNGVDIDFNTTLATNSQVFMQLPTGIPYSNDSTPNEIVIETEFGITSTHFIIGQPYPTITKYPLALIGGETVTITGEDFNNLELVKFGTILGGVDTTVMGEIISFTEKSITVKVPSVVPSKGNIFVKTPGGTAIAAVVYGSDYPVFEESELFDDWSWAAIHEPSSEKVRDGVYAEKVGFNGWDALYMHLLTPINLSEYKFLKISIYSATNTKLKVFLDWSNPDSKAINVAEGKWNDLLIPVSDLTTNVNNATSDFVIQEFTGSAGTIYIDSVGFIK